MLKAHLDTDLGGDIDDLCALALLLRWPGLEMTGITTVADENGRRAGYARYALKQAGREDIPVAAGADVSLGCYRFKPVYPDEAAYWPEPVSPAPGPLDAALDLLKCSIEQGALIIGIGPYTNLHLLEQQHPGILRDADLYLMGGHVYPPRDGFPAWDNYMDYNVQLDMQAARHVLECTAPTLIPLSVTVETALRRAHLEGLRKTDWLGTLIARQAEVFATDWHNEATYGKSCARLPDDTINFQHDPLACAIALGWRDGVSIAEVPLRQEVVDGWLCERIDDTGKPVQIVTQINGDQFSQFWFDMVTGDR